MNRPGSIVANRKQRPLTALRHALRLPLIGGLAATDPLYAQLPEITAEGVIDFIVFLVVFAAVFALSLYLVPFKKPR